jgi:hypothetical protein
LAGKDASISDAPPFGPAGAANTVNSLTHAARAGRSLWWWAALAAAALAVAAAFALVLAALRTPGVQDLLPDGWNRLFARVLVTHVVLASGVWCLAALGAMATFAAGRRAPAPWAGTAPAGVLAGVLLLLVPTLAGLGEVSPNDYVPVIVHPFYYAGLVCVALGVSVPVLRLLRSVDFGRPFAVAVAAAGAMAILAFACVVVVWARLPGGLHPGAYNTLLFWGGGHILQFAYTALALAGWSILAERAYGLPPLPPVAFAAAVASLLPFVCAGPIYAATLELPSAAYRDAFTDLMRWGLVAGPLAVAAGTLRLAWRRPCLNRTAAATLLLSVSLFVLGGAAGFFLPGGDTRTPAHYHASLAGVNLALMGVFWEAILPALGRLARPSGLVRLQIALFGFGQLVFAAGLFAAGMEGVPRKAAGLAQNLDSGFKLAAMGLAGVGAIVAVAGGVLFVALISARLLGRPDGRP